eukprot:1193928-Prorocentrum_minimum.AAC.4
MESFVSPGSSGRDSASPSSSYLMPPTPANPCSPEYLQTSAVMPATAGRVPMPAGNRCAQVGNACRIVDLVDLVDLVA